MQLPIKTHYACKALLELALHWPNKKPLPIQTIADRQEIPMRYLVQILLQMKRADLVKSVRGKDGGYLLLHAPEAITFGEFIEKFGGAIIQLPESVDAASDLFGNVWRGANETVMDSLNQKTFRDFVNIVLNKTQSVAYRI